MRILITSVILAQPAFGFDPVCAQVFLKAPLKEEVLYKETFLAPNEVNPEHAMPILNKMKPGTLVTVGTERGFLYAGMSSNVLSLALIDFDPAVVRFNRINVALLKASENRKDYLYLRLKAGKEEWSKRGILNHDVDAAEWWRKEIQYNPKSSSANRNFFMHDKNSGFFEKVNYLYFDEQFARVKILADEDRIFVDQADLGNPAHINLVSAALKSSRYPVTALDVSNAWEDQYAGNGGIDRFLNTMQVTLDPQALLILTDLSPSSAGYWQYYAYWVADIFSIKARAQFWKWFQVNRTAHNLSSAHLEVLSPRVRAALANQFGDHLENLTYLLRSDDVSEKSLALDILLDKDVFNPEIVSELMKIVGNANEVFGYTPERVLYVIAGKHNEYGRQMLEFAQQNKGMPGFSKLAEAITRIVPTNGENALRPFLDFFYEALEMGKPGLYFISVLQRLDAIEPNKALYLAKLVQLKSRLEKSNSYNINFIKVDHVETRIRRLNAAFGGE